jgi:hypothetical protein
MTAPFEHHSDRDPVEQERNPHGWDLFHLDEIGLKVLKGQHEDSGDMYEARITTDYTDDTVKLVLVFKNIQTNEVNVYVAVYKWVNKESIDDALFYKEKADGIGLWGLRYNLPIEFTKSAWRWSRKLFNDAVSDSSVYACKVKREKENKAKEDSRDLFL